MGYDWNRVAEERSLAERVPAGTHDLTIRNIVFGSKARGLFASRDGSKQMLIVFGDNQDREVAKMYTLSEKAAWTLAQLADAVGLDLRSMTADGVTPEKFAEQGFAEEQLLGRELRAEVSYSTGENGKENADVKPLRRAPTAGENIPI